MFNATTQAVVAVAFLHLKGLDGSLLHHDGQKVGIDLFGPGSDEFAEVADRQSERMRKRMEENDGNYVQPPRQEREAEAAEDLAALTAGFVNLGYPPAGEARGRELYRAFYSDRTLGHFRLQAQAMVGDWGKFAPTPSGG